MKYRLTCLTPTLVGDGQRLSPIDYMVWKDHVNVLDQWRIFRLLAKGPRLESYLTQLKKADKLDFASWGGFAQNYAGRRIPFEHASSTQYWERTHAEHLFIPTFSTGPSGPYLPGTAIKGAFRTGVVHGRLTERLVTELATRIESEGRMPRRPAISIEESALRAIGRRSACAWSPRTIRRPSRDHVQDLSAAHVNARIARRRQIRTGMEADSARHREARRRLRRRYSPRWPRREACSKASGIRTHFFRSLKSARRCAAALPSMRAPCSSW